MTSNEFVLIIFIIILVILSVTVSIVIIVSSSRSAKLTSSINALETVYGDMFSPFVLKVAKEYFAHPDIAYEHNNAGFFTIIPDIEIVCIYGHAEFYKVYDVIDRKQVNEDLTYHDRLLLKRICKLIRERQKEPLPEYIKTR